SVSANGQFLASTGYSGNILIWDLTGRAQPRPAQVTPGLLERLWSDLADADAALAFQAMRTLTALGDDGVTLLGSHLRPCPGPDAKRIKDLIAALASKVFALRDTAQRELLKLQDAAEPYLEELAGGGANLEVRERATQILRRLNELSP